MIQKFRKRTIVINDKGTFNAQPHIISDAIQFKGDENLMEILEWMRKWGTNGGGDNMVIKTLEGDMTANRSDFIVKDVNGTFLTYKPDVFEKTYEPVND
jgi:hypothetical protein